ncbi:hypothetical protein H0H93_005718, partial [Arthromyces matolae]
KGITEDELTADLAKIIENSRSEAENRSQDTENVLVDADIELPVIGNTVEQILSGEGIRVQADNDSEPEDEPNIHVRRKKTFSKQANGEELKYLNMFACTTKCRRMYRSRFLQTHPISLCQTRGAVITVLRLEEVIVQKVSGLKRGKKKQVSSEDSRFIQEHLENWRDSELVEEYYGDVGAFSGSAILSDDIVEKIVNCGERLATYVEFRQHAHWFLGHDEASGGPNTWGQKLLNQLSIIYNALDIKKAEEHRREAATTAWEIITPENFYYQAEYAPEKSSPSGSDMSIDEPPQRGQSRGRSRGRGRGRGRGRARGSQAGQTRRSRGGRRA